MPHWEKSKVKSQKSKVGSSKLRHIGLRAGFTLIEFLLVLGLLSITIGSSMLFLTNLIKGSNQANIVAETKQNGQATLDLLERRVRNAITADQPAPNYVRLQLDNNIYLHVRCFLVSTSALPNMWIGVTETSTQIDYSADTAGNNFTAITNQDPVSGVNVDDCTLAVVPGSSGGSSPPIVNINFTLSQGAYAPSRQDFKAQAQFQTSISLRSY